MTETVLITPLGAPGVNGALGWSPVLADVVDGARVVQQVVDWVGGTGTKPAVGDYVGPAGLVPDIEDATDIAALLETAAAPVLQAITDAGGAQVQAITDAGGAQVQAITDAGGEQTGLVVAAGGVQTTAIGVAGAAQLALIAAAQGGDLFPTTADALSSGALAVQSITPGSGGTNGAFDAIVSGGGGTGMAIRFVVSGGAVTGAIVMAAGINYTSAPTISLANSAGLTGAAVTVTLGARTSVGEYFSTPGTNGAALNVYRVSTGPVAALIKQIWESNAADPQTLLQVSARYGTQVSAGLRNYPPLLPLRDYTGTLSSGTRNANGTITMAAGSTWTSPTLGFSPFNVAGARVAYVVLTEPLTDAIEMQFAQGGTIIAAYATTTQPSPGVYKLAWDNAVPASSPTLTIRNKSAVSVTRYVLETYSTDSVYLPQVLSFDKKANVPENRVVIDWDDISPYVRWSQNDQAMRAADEGNITHAFDSVGGSDAAAGTLLAPKQNLLAGSALSPGSVLGLKRGSVWNQSLAVMLGTSTKLLRVRGYSEGTALQPLPILDAGLDITANTWVDEGSDTFSTTFPCAADLIPVGQQNYSYGTVLETTVADAATKPLGSTRLFEAVDVILTGPNPAADQTVAINNVKALAGRSLVVFTVGNTTATVYVHTQDGIAPNASPTYSYKVSNFNACMDWVQGNTRQAVVMGVEFRQGARGLGIVCGSNLSMFSGVIASHGFKHTFHIEGGVGKNLLVYNKVANASPIPNSVNCYVSPSANGLSWVWENVAIYDSASPLYSHAAAGAYENGKVRYVWAIASPRTASGSLVIGDPIASARVKRTEEEWCLIQGYSTSGRSSTGAENLSTIIRNSLCNGIGRFSTRKLNEHCLVKVTNISGSVERGMRMVDTRDAHIVRNGLFYGSNVQTTEGDGFPTDYRCTLFNFLATGFGGVDISRNIFLVDTPLTPLASGTVIVSESAAGMTWTSDFNVFIFCSKGPIASTKFGMGQQTTIAGYLANFVGHDTNSLFLDLRDDPRGAQAIFMDPANGDFRWAQTPEAEIVKAYCFLNGVGPWWTTQQNPTIPTIDEARMLMIGAV